MNPIRLIKGKIRARRARIERSALRTSTASVSRDIPLKEWADSLADPTGFYLRAVEYFDRSLPEEFRVHRNYFTQNGRGFGEDAFHTMWFLLFREFRPKSFLEIGVFRGQSLSLAGMCARHFQLVCLVQGISPFTFAGDSVSKYSRHVDYLADTLGNFSHFQLAPPSLLKAYSTDPEARNLIASRDWDLIYIDGNHDYAVAREDWELCSKHVRTQGLIVLDDSGLGTAFRPPSFATAGHPGPSQLAKEINRNEFAEILQVGHNRVFQKVGT